MGLKMRIFLAFPLCLALLACATNPKPYIITAAFDAAKAKQLLQDGPNTIQGNAFMRQVGGGIVTCAGAPVQLVPATEYTDERMMAVYGPVESGRHKIIRDFGARNDDYERLVRTTTCDSAGNFQFSNVSDGDFYVVTVVAWSVRYSLQGGTLMHKVRVKNKQNVRLVLSS